MFPNVGNRRILRVLVREMEKKKCLKRNDPDEIKADICFSNLQVRISPIYKTEFVVKSKTHNKNNNNNNNNIIEFFVPDIVLSAV